VYELENRKDISDTLRKLEGIRLSTVGEDYERYSQMMSGLELKNMVKKEEVPELSDGESDGGAGRSSSSSSSGKEEERERENGSSVREDTEEVKVEGILEADEIPLSEILPVQALIVAGIL